MRRKRRSGGPRAKDAAPGDHHRINVIITWTAVLVVLVLGVLAVVFWLWLRPLMNRHAPSEAEQTAALVEKRKISAFDSPSEDAALALVKEAIALRDPAMVETYFRTGSAEPAAVTAFLTGMPERDGAVTGFQWLSSMDANGMLLDGVLVNLSRDGAPRNRLALLTPDDQGVWKIDFDAFARTVEPSWNEILAEGGGEGLVRVMIARDSYYNGPFKDDGEWVSYGMASPDTEVILLGYCRKGSPQQQAMERILTNREAPAGMDARRKLNRVTLGVRRPEAAELRQFEITRVFAEDWVLGDAPFDAAFK